MHPRHHAASEPDRPALIFSGTGRVVTYSQLVAGANRCAHLLHSLGLKTGDVVAVLMENQPSSFEVFWATQSNGWYFTPISPLLTAREVAYIVNDSGAKVLLTSHAQAETAAELRALIPKTPVFMTDGAIPGYRDYDAERDTYSDSPAPGEHRGGIMLYSSGTTGFPKGIKPPLTTGPLDELPPLSSKLRELYELDRDTVYLSPAPLYHAAPLKFNMTMHYLGATSVVMEKFDAERALSLIEEHRVTHSQWVPTMFIRMLRLPEATRKRYDLSSLKKVIHAAAPCPIDIKHQMIDWLGPIIYEYYGGSESNGLCGITTEEWLKRPGSVGRPVRGEMHIMDETGERDLPQGEAGVIYFAGGTPFHYHNDPAKTKSATNSHGWTTIGDIGYVDEGGYLFLTDRRDNMIVSGGVNIYPQEAENVLAGHPKVVDVAVLGVPHPDFGESVKAVVQPLNPADAGPELERELLDYCLARLATYKCPRSVDFVDTLPRLPTGKLLKRLLRERYWRSGKDGKVSLAEQMTGAAKV